MQKKKESSQEVYWMRVSLPCCDRQGKPCKIYRDIHVYPTDSLHALAQTIVTDGFGFDFDHCFGFYTNLNGPSRNGDCYELFAEIEGSDGDPEVKGVSDVYVQDVFSPKSKMLFLFDYGDYWRFIVHCRRILSAQPDVSYPQIVASVGEAPQQYPDVDENEEV